MKALLKGQLMTKSEIFSYYGKKNCRVKIVFILIFIGTISYFAFDIYIWAVHKILLLINFEYFMEKFKSN